MEPEHKIALSVRRLEIAEERLKTAKHNLEFGDYKAAANRLYYAIFSAMRAVLALDGFDSKKHSGIISEFRRKYIKNNIFAPEMSDIIGELEIIRENSDYDDFYIISKEDVIKQSINAEFFVCQVKAYLLYRYDEQTK